MGVIFKCNVVGEVSLPCLDGREQKPFSWGSFPPGRMRPERDREQDPGGSDSGYSLGWSFAPPPPHPSSDLGVGKDPPQPLRSIPGCFGAMGQREMLNPRQPASLASHCREPVVDLAELPARESLDARSPSGVPVSGCSSPQNPSQAPLPVPGQPLHPTPLGLCLHSWCSGGSRSLPCPSRIKTSSIVTAAARNPWQISAITAGNTLGAELITPERCIKSHWLSAGRSLASPTRVVGDGVSRPRGKGTGFPGVVV